MSNAFADLDPSFDWIWCSDNEPEVARWDATAAGQYPGEFRCGCGG